jgi:hypothetical protein
MRLRRKYLYIFVQVLKQPRKVYFYIKLYMYILVICLSIQHFTNSATVLRSIRSGILQENGIRGMGDKAVMNDAQKTAAN